MLNVAVAIADAEGVSALTMRRVASAVGVEAMSLYHHLPNKEALLDGVVDTVVGEIHERLEAEVSAPAADDWRVTLRQRFLTARTVMLRHPWAPGLIGTRSAVPASIYGLYEALLATMVGAGFSYHVAHRALHTFGSMPLGFVQELFSPAAAGADEADDDLEAMAEAFPHLTAMVAAEVHDAADAVLGWCDSQTEFEFTLDLLLDGFARQL
ncbi:TetR/AcrR family transcriptional regulator C-terminal domain-containing protein [Nocardioides glacieisoli]|uniref:TetR/AcrR family transcriptional regulator C-terminal domain-containing protein n=1 Tax=Nocardioides glacieisoli TaxID=1168730 RepID=UPI001A922CA6|nr:TetR/AcrR family transcriptional regulator C-terminal domain-containing protein [Nocardioides glacieisoli]